MSLKTFITEELLRPANLLSLSRIPIAVIIILFFGNKTIFFSLLALAAITDLLDGYVARKTKPTRLGPSFDGFSDKVFFAILLLFLVFSSHLNLFQLFLLMIRDISVALLSLAVWLHPKKEEIIKRSRSRWPSKITTAGQFIAVVWLFLGFNSFNYILYPTALVALIAAIDYAVFVKKNL